jgi:hypothetical protein
MTSQLPAITTDSELAATLDRIRHFQAQLLTLRQAETDPAAYRLAAAGFIAELDRMQAVVRDYLTAPASKLAASA